jgi:hypothetical protein
MIEGTVKLKKVAVEGAIYALSLPGLQTANLVVPVIPGEVPAVEGIVTVTFPDLTPKVAGGSSPAKKKK